MSGFTTLHCYNFCVNFWEKVMLTLNFVFTIVFPKLKIFSGHVYKNYHFNKLNQFLKYGQIFQCTLPSSMRHNNNMLCQTFLSIILFPCNFYAMTWRFISLLSSKLISGIYGILFDIIVSLVHFLFIKILCVYQRELEFENYLYNLKENSDLYTSVILVSCSCKILKFLTENTQIEDKTHFIHQ